MSRGNTFLALLAGTAMGAVAGILYAPERGTVTRQKLKEGIDDAKSNLKGKITNASYDLEETYENLVSTMSHKAEDVISFLETKLADLKQQNAKFQKDSTQNQFSE